MAAAEIDSIERFKSAEKLCAYAGLVPSTYSSGGNTWHGRMLPFCNRWLRWAFIEAAGSALKSKDCPRNLRRLHHRLTHGGQVRLHEAKVAVARELCQLVYVIWKKGEPYREPKPARPKRAQRLA